MARLEYKKNALQCNFIRVPVGGSYEQLVKEINLKTVPLDYHVKVEHYSRSCLDFTVRPRKFINIKTNERIIVSIVYTPSIPNKTDLFYFNIERSDGFVLHVEVKGESIGPKVLIPQNIFKFDCRSLAIIQKKSFIIQNNSEAGAYFMFDCNVVECVTLEPELGYLEPLETSRIIISYKNNSKFQKFHRFMCLIQNHVPILIHVMAIPLEKKSNDGKQLVKPMLPHSVKTYLPINEISSDHLKRLIDSSEFSANSFRISESQVDFGLCRLGETSQRQITLTNLSGAETVLHWVSTGQSDCEEAIFTIKPERKIISPFQEISIDLSFIPKQHDKFYSTRFDATLYWGKAMILTPIRINLMGNSFQNNCWIAQYELDLLNNTIHLVSGQGFEGEILSRTFTLRKLGNLPMMFKLHSDDVSSFIIEPRHGVIYGPYQIFTVKMKATNRNYDEKSWKEVWTLELNLNYKVEITLIGTHEEPDLIVNNGKRIKFAVTHPMSCQRMCIELKNPSQSDLRYSIEVSDELSPFKLDLSHRIIISNERKKLFWFFVPKEIGDYECSATLLIHKMNSDEISKRIPIFISGECKTSHLKVDKNKFPLGKVILGSFKLDFFSIMNDGDAPLHLSLGCKTSSGNEIDDILFHPPRLSIEAGASVHVELRAKPQCIDQHWLKIGCNLRSSPFSRQIIPNTWMDLAVFDMIGVYPRLKIIDVRMESIPFLTRYNIWNTLDINRINAEISDLTFIDCTKKLEINLPILKSRAPFNNRVELEMLIRNESDCNVEWSLKKKEFPCTCNPEEKKIGFNKFIKELTCDHVNQIIIKPTFGILKSFETMLWTISTKYSTPGVQSVEYELNMFPENKPESAARLFLIFSRYVPDDYFPVLFPCNSPQISGEINFNMQPIFINELKSQAQVFWVYNPSEYPVLFSVKRKNGGSNNIKCLNPYDSVRPWSHYPITFSYLPQTFDPVETNFSISFHGNEHYILTVSGSSQFLPQYNPFVLCNKMTVSKSMLPQGEIDLSVNHIAFPILPPFCEVDKILFMNNRTKEVFKYRWERVLIKKRLKLEVVPRSGYIQPKQKCLLTLKCSILGRTCHLVTGLICRIVNETLTQKQREKKLKFLQEEEILAEEFTITEKGISFHEKRALPEEEVNQKFLILNVSVVSTTVSLKNIDKHARGIGLRGRITNALAFRSPSDEMERIACENHSAEILSNCLWDLLRNPNLQSILKRGLPCFYYKDLLNRDDEDGQNDGKCPMIWATTVLKKVISGLLADLEPLDLFERKTEIYPPSIS